MSYIRKTIKYSGRVSSGKIIRKDDLNYLSFRSSFLSNFAHVTFDEISFELKEVYSPHASLGINVDPFQITENFRFRKIDYDNFYNCFINLLPDATFQGNFAFDYLGARWEKNDFTYLGFRNVLVLDFFIPLDTWKALRKKEFSIITEIHTHPGSNKLFLKNARYQMQL